MRTTSWLILSFLLHFSFSLIGQEVVVESLAKPINLEERVTIDTPIIPKVRHSVSAPIVQWLFPQEKDYVTDKDFIDIRLEINTKNAVTDENFKVLRNSKTGSKAKESSLLKKNGYIYSCRIWLEEGDNEFEIEMMSEQGIKVIASRKIFKQTSAQTTLPKLHILSVGPRLNLSYTEKDAKDFLSLFSKQGGTKGNHLFESVITYELTGKDATTENIKRNLENLSNQMKQGLIAPIDLVVIYISSHGILLEDDFRILGNDYTVEYAKTYSVSYSKDILFLLDEITCKKMILLDACHGGGAKVDPKIINAHISKIKKINGLTAIASSKGEEYSYEDDNWKNGAFTEGIINGLGYGKADSNQDKVITVKELYSYLLETVPPMVLEVKNRAQHPSLITNQLGDLPFFILR